MPEARNPAARNDVTPHAGDACVVRVWVLQGDAAADKGHVHALHEDGHGERRKRRCDGGRNRRLTQPHTAVVRAEKDGRAGPREACDHVECPTPWRLPELSETNDRTRDNLHSLKVFADERSALELEA